MNQWKFHWVYDGNHWEIIEADTLDIALAKWRDKHRALPPGIALWKVECVK